MPSVLPIQCGFVKYVIAYKKGFDVDVNVEVRGGKPIAYRIVAVHDVIDLPDDA